MLKQFIKQPLLAAACIACGPGLFSTGANAAMINVDITASWTAADFSVTDPADPLYNPADPAVDGKVLGVSPSAGSTTIHLIVDTSSFVSYSAGYTYNYLGTDYTLAHDWYGYQNVQLASPYSFGTASWDSSGILTDLLGPDGVGAALWTDTDITSGDPTLASFRMFGTDTGVNPDLFVGPRTNQFISTQFLLGEYYNGEDISVDGYTVTASVVPVPAAAWLFGSGLVGLVGIARRKA